MSSWKTQRAAVCRTPDTGHWTPDENPEFLADQLVRFFGHEQSGAR
jgi:hypothetical protein